MAVKLGTEEEQVNHRGWALCPRGGSTALCSTGWSASAIKESLQKDEMAVLTSFLNDNFGGGAIMIWRGSEREYYCLRSLTWVNQEFLCCEDIGWARECYHVDCGGGCTGACGPEQG